MEGIALVLLFIVYIDVLEKNNFLVFVLLGLSLLGLTKFHIRLIFRVY